MLTGSLPPISRRATYIETLELIDDDTGDPIDLTGADIRVELCANIGRDDYGWWDWPATTSATLADGITVPEAGIVQWRFEAGRLSRFARGAAGLRVIISRDGDTDVVARLTLPVED